MLTTADLRSYGAPAELVQAWSQQVSELTEIQERAVRAGALDGHSNLLVVAPTSSGKTFVGEMAATLSAYTMRQHSIFIVPFKALADEQFETFKRQYGDLLSVVISTADWTENDADIRAGNFNLAVMTYEKLLGFLMQQSDLIRRCTTLVIDEIQLLGDGERGARLEILLTRVMLDEAPPQIVGLSASLDDVNQLDAWLKAKLVSSTERPVPLVQTVCEPSGAAVSASPDSQPVPKTLTRPSADREELAITLALQLIQEQKQVIIFRSSIRNVMETSRRLRTRLPAVGVSQHTGEQLGTLDDSESISNLRLCLASHVGFHNADLTRQERSIVENAFRSGEARALVATTTLAMGVNMPTDAVIIADSSRFSPTPTGWSTTNISVAEYRNAAGRAGRLGKRSQGESILLADNMVQLRQLVNQYLLGQVEPISSQLPNRPLDDIVFDILCSRFTQTSDGIVDFLANTFGYLTFYDQVGGGLHQVQESVQKAVQTCLESGLVVQDEGELHPTQAASIFGAAGLSLSSASRLASLLENSATSHISDKDVLLEIASCRETGERPWLRRAHGVEKDPRPQCAPDNSNTAPNSRLAQILAKPVLKKTDQKSLARMRCLQEWMTGKSYRAIATQFKGMGAAAARVRDLGKNSAWLLDTLFEAARAREDQEPFAHRIHSLALQARYGLPDILAPIARLQVPGISRENLLGLVERNEVANIHEAENILDAPDDAFQGILTPLQVCRLREAILSEIKDSVRRRRAGQLARATQAGLPQKLVDDLYATSGEGLEQAVADALTHAGVPTSRVLRQPHGEEDLRITHIDGTIIVSVTASRDDARPIRWNKAKEILGAGAGNNPINYICIGRPSFDSLAERSTTDIARESGPRSLLLIPIPILAEAIVLIGEGVIDSQEFANLLARGRGLLTRDSLPNGNSNT